MLSQPVTKSMMEQDNPKPEAELVSNMPATSPSYSLVGTVGNEYFSPSKNNGIRTERVRGKSKILESLNSNFQNDNGQKRSKIQVINLDSDSDNDDNTTGNMQQVSQPPFESQTISCITLDSEDDNYRYDNDHNDNYPNANDDNDDDDIEVLSVIDYNESQYQMKWSIEGLKENTEVLEVTIPNESQTGNIEENFHTEHSAIQAETDIDKNLEGIQQQTPKTNNECVRQSEETEKQAPSQPITKEIKQPETESRVEIVDHDLEQFSITCTEAEDLRQSSFTPSPKPSTLYKPSKSEPTKKVESEVETECSTPLKKPRFSINKTVSPSSCTNKQATVTSSPPKTPNQSSKGQNGHSTPKCGPLVHFLDDDDVFPIIPVDSTSLSPSPDKIQSASTGRSSESSALSNVSDDSTPSVATYVDGRFILSPEQRTILTRRKKSLPVEKRPGRKPINLKHSLAYYHDPEVGTLCNICGLMDTSNKDLQTFVLNGIDNDMSKPFYCLSCNERFAHGELAGHKAECFLTYKDPKSTDKPRNYRMMACDKCVLSYKQVC